MEGRFIQEMHSLEEIDQIRQIRQLSQQIHRQARALNRDSRLEHQETTYIHVAIVLKIHVGKLQSMYTQVISTEQATDRCPRLIPLSKLTYPKLLDLVALLLCGLCVCSRIGQGPRSSKDAAKKGQNAGGTKHHAGEQGQAGDEDFLLRLSRGCQGAVELNCADLLDGPGIGRELSHGHAVGSLANEVPGLEAAATAPLHGDWGIIGGIDPGEVGVFGVKVPEGFQLALFAVQFVVGVDGDGVQSAAADDIVAGGGRKEQVWRLECSILDSVESLAGGSRLRDLSCLAAPCEVNVELGFCS